MGAFSHLENNTVVRICDDLMPTNGNYGYRQLESIWTSFCLADPILPRPEIRGRIDELVNKRIAIAHGIEDAKTVGSHYTISELTKIYEDVNELCSYIIQSLENHAINSNFLKS